MRKNLCNEVKTTEVCKFFFCLNFGKIKFESTDFNKRANRARIIGRLELISSKCEEFEKFCQMKEFPQKKYLCKASFTFVTSSRFFKQYI